MKRSPQPLAGVLPDSGALTPSAAELSGSPRPVIRHCEGETVVRELAMPLRDGARLVESARTARKPVAYLTQNSARVITLARELTP